MAKILSTLEPLLMWLGLKVVRYSFDSKDRWIDVIYHPWFVLNPIHLFKIKHNPLFAITKANKLFLGQVVRVRKVDDKYFALVDRRWMFHHKDRRIKIGWISLDSCFLVRLSRWDALSMQELALKQHSNGERINDIRYQT